MRYPGHEALWCYRRWLFAVCIEWCGRDAAVGLLDSVQACVNSDDMNATFARIFLTWVTRFYGTTLPNIDQIISTLPQRYQHVVSDIHKDIHQ